MQHPGHVDAVLVDLQVGEDALDALAPLGQPGNRTQEVAVPDPSLQDVARIDRVSDEDRILDDVTDALPAYLLKVLAEPEGLLLSGEFGISPHLVGLLVILDQLLVVGLHDFLERVVLLVVFLVDVVDDVVEVVAFGVASDVIDDFGVGYGPVGVDVGSQFHGLGLTDH